LTSEREQFGKRLEDSLIKQGMTHRKAAELVNCTGATMGRWTRGEGPYCIMVLAGLRRELGIDLNELICGTKPQIKNTKEI